MPSSACLGVPSGRLLLPWCRYREVLKEVFLHLCSLRLVKTIHEFGGDLVGKASIGLDTFDWRGVKKSVKRNDEIFNDRCA